MKIALITGAGRGIGAAIAHELASMGYYILLNYKSNRDAAAATLQTIRNDLAGEGELMPFDVADTHQTRSAIENWQKAHPNLYIEALVNNAGIRKDNLLLWMLNNEWKEVIDINLNSFFNVTQPVLKDMLHRRNGRIVNVVSLSGLKGMKGQTNYSAAKGGLIAATKALAAEVAPRKVTVNAIAPGFIETDMTADLDPAQFKDAIPMGRFGTAREVAATAGFLVSEKASYITGEVISVNGGLYM